MKKFLIGILGIILMISSMSVAFADNGTYMGNYTAKIDENGEEVEYDAFCIDQKKSISKGTKINTTDNMNLKEGTIEYIIENWYPGIKNNDSAYKELQEGLWKITEDEDRKIVTYPDFYKYKKTFGLTEKVETIEEINGVKWKVTTWMETGYEFVFRMFTDGHGLGYQDLLMYLTNPFSNEMKTFEEIPNPPTDPKDPVIPDDPEEPINPDNPENPVTPNEPENSVLPEDSENSVTPYDSQENVVENQSKTPILSDENGNGLNNNVSEFVQDGTINIVGKAAMKNTGIPIFVILLVLISSLVAFNVKKGK